MVTSLSTKTAKGRPARQLSTEIEQLLRSTYDGSATTVHRLAQQQSVSDSTIRTWARRLGLTQRSRPRPQGQNHARKQVFHLPESAPPPFAPDTQPVTVNLLRAYLQEMARYPRLTGEEEYQLGKRAAVGDQEAKHLLILCNLRLVVRIARYYAKKNTSSLDVLDLIQEGTLGLMSAVDSFDAARGWRFSTYATWWIRQAVSRALLEQSRTIRLPVGAQEQIADIQEIIKETQEDCPLDLIAERLSISPKRAQELLTASQSVYSLDAPAFGALDELELGSVLEAESATPQDHMEAMDLRHQLLCLIRTLPPRDAQVIVLRYGLDGKGERTLETVGKLLGVSRERIRQIETRVLLELRETAQTRHLQDYLSA